MHQSIKYILRYLTVVLMATGMVHAQVPENSELFRTLKAKDSVLFEIGFNQCKVERSAELIADDLEFYHDKSGVSASKAEFVNIMKNGLCHKDRPEQTYRFLVDHSLTVYPLYDNGQLYGALQTGKHYFSTDRTMTFKASTNYALFSHLWILENTSWKLKRVISYNHSSKKSGLE